MKLYDLFCGIGIVAIAAILTQLLLLFKNRLKRRIKRDKRTYKIKSTKNL